MKLFLLSAALSGFASAAPTTLVTKVNTTVPQYATAASGTWTGTPAAYTQVLGASQRPKAAYQGKDPAGNTTIQAPAYRALSAFDYASFNLALYQEWIELDLFHYGIAAFSEQQWADAGLNAELLYLLSFMANQETGHAQLLTNILGPGAAKQCTYNYSGAFNDPRSYIEFNAQLTKWGESGVLGFLSHLNSRDSANLLAQSIATEGRQQMIFRQFSGSHPMPVFFETGLPQSWAWSLLAPWIQSCPPENPKVEWSIYPQLRIENNPSLTTADSKAAIVTNKTALTSPGETIYVNWDKPGKKIGPDLAYTTSINTTEPAKYALLVAQLNATFVPLTNISGNSAQFTLPPYTEIFPGSNIQKGENILNDTNFVALTSRNPVLTSYNLSLINPYVVAGPALINFG